jgi:hypothetical protein
MRITARVSVQPDTKGDDIRKLYELCGLRTADQGLDLLQSYYPDHLILRRVKFLLQEMFPETDPKEMGDGYDR